VSGPLEGGISVVGQPDFADAFGPTADFLRHLRTVPEVDQVAGRSRQLRQARVLGGCVQRNGIRQFHHDVAIARGQRVGHPPGQFHAVDAPVVLGVIESPGSPLSSVIGLERVLAYSPPVPAIRGPLPRAVGIVAGTADEAGVAGRPGRRVNARLQAQAVDVVAKGLHVGKFFIGLDGVVRSAAVPLPAIVDVDVLPPVVDQAGIDHRLGRRPQVGVRDLRSPAAPGVAAQQRR